MVKKSILLSVMFFIILNVQAIHKFNCKIEVADTTKFSDDLITYISTSPVFDGDIEGFINKELIYPPQALADSLEGVVYVSLYIDTLGQTFNHSITRGINPELDQEALRVAKLIHFKKPAMQKEKTIIVPLIVPVRFRLSDIQYLLNRQNRASNQLEIFIQYPIVKHCHNCWTISFEIAKDTLHINKITYTIFFKSKKDRCFITKISKESEILSFSNNKRIDNNTYTSKYDCIFYKEKDIELLSSLKKQKNIGLNFFKMNNVERLKYLDYLYYKYNKNL